MNPNAIKLSVEQLPNGGGPAQFSLSSHKIYLYNEQQLKIRNCGDGTETFLDLSSGGKGIGVINSHFCVGTLQYNGPVSTLSINLSSGSDKGYFQHQALSNAFGPSLNESPGIDAEFIGADDLRDECGLAGNENPRIHRFLLSKAFVHLRVEQDGNDNILTVTFQANALDSGYSLWVATK